jgi:hypothetical protein
MGFAPLNPSYSLLHRQGFPRRQCTFWGLLLAVVLSSATTAWAGDLRGMTLRSVEDGAYLQYGADGTYIYSNGQYRAERGWKQVGNDVIVTFKTEVADRTRLFGKGGYPPRSSIPKAGSTI